MTQLTHGIVKWFDSQKGYGFISYGDDQDIFVHFTSILEDGFKTLEANQAVEFEIRDGARGQQAAQVKKI